MKMFRKICENEVIPAAMMRLKNPKNVPFFEYFCMSMNRARKGHF